MIKNKIFNFEKKNIKFFHDTNSNKKIVFTNGCFDILHKGHVDYLYNTKKLADILVVGLNSDQSVKTIKGDSRPINDIKSRSFVLASLISVDYVFIFNEPTPLKLIQSLKPDILVKGDDYNTDEIIGSDFVKKNNGIVKTIKLTKGYSTTNIINRILSLK